MTDTPHIIEVAIPVPLEQTFHYSVPESLREQAVAGHRVFVPFGGRRLTGYILGSIPEAPVEKLKDIIEVLDIEPLWTAEELEFFRWVASYYMHPLGDVLKTALPSGINIQSKKGAPSQTGNTGGNKAKTEKFYRPSATHKTVRQAGGKASEILAVIRDVGDIPGADLRRRFGQCSQQLKRLLELGFIVMEEREVYRDPFRNEIVLRDAPRKLNSHQQAALESVVAAIDKSSFAPFLLHGVTGSGKTEVYLQAIAHALNSGLNALVLVPEIALTPQLVQRFRARFDNGIAILHSGLSDGERYDEWRRIRRGLVRIVIGARSAVFAPLARIGIVVVDEEHETSFKQSDGLRYNARDLALVRGSMEKCTVLLGSATPLMTSLYAITQGKLTLLNLPERVEQRPLPDVILEPMKKCEGSIGSALTTALEETLAARQQAIVFLNRRGFATFLLCAECGQPLSCPNCSVTLTHHRQRGRSICHYCDYSVPAPGTCPSCGCPELKELGAGTERVEHELRERFPEARILRMDSDTTSGRGGHQRLLSKMADGSADILVGTQMIAKGHDFPGVTLVGVVNAEASLAMPDFRAAERTFQLLSQVIGRSGRGELPGRVIIQSYSTDHYAVQCAAGHNSSAFSEQELRFREEAGYPPFTHLACIGFSGTAEKPVDERAELVSRILAEIKRADKLRVEILGPAPAPIYRLRGRYRRQILLKSPTRKYLRAILSALRRHNPPISAVRESIDIDPLDML